MRPQFIEQSLDLLDREIRDRFTEVIPANDVHRRLFEDRMQFVYNLPVPADQEQCAQALTVLDAFLQRRIRLIYAPAPFACEAEHGRFRSDGTMWIRPGAPARMLQTMVHEMGHMFFHGIGIPHQALSDEEHEFVAESVGYCVLRALGVDTLAHSAAYLVPNCLNGGFGPGPGHLRAIIVPIVEAILRLFRLSELKGIT
jgi:hypothetical protein